MPQTHFMSQGVTKELVFKMIEKIDAKELFAPQTEIWEKSLNEYKNKKSVDIIKKAFYLTKSEASSPTPENTAVMLVRIAVSDLEGKLSEERKYVLLQTFYDEGDLATIDIVRLPLGFHKEIVKEYLTKVLTEDLSRQLIPLHDGRSRYLTAGGYFESNGKKIRFHGASSDFSNKLSVYDVNDIASYLAAESGLFETVESVNIFKGKEYIERCLEIMCNYKLRPDFYSQLVDLYLSENVRTGQGIGSHLLYSLTTMKSIDKALKEGKDITQVLVEESAEGIGREMLITGVAERLRKKKE